MKLLESSSFANRIEPDSAAVFLRAARSQRAPVQPAWRVPAGPLPAVIYGINPAQKQLKISCFSTPLKKTQKSAPVRLLFVPTSRPKAAASMPAQPRVVNPA